MLRSRSQAPTCAFVERKFSREREGTTEDPPCGQQDRSTLHSLLRSLAHHVREALVVGVAFAVFVAAGLAESTARADDVSFDGAWSMSDVAESFVVKHWGAACGPPPVTGTMLPATQVGVREERGELSIASDRRTLRTDECLDPMPALVRASHAHDTRSWRTGCVTPPSDPRRAVVNTAFFVAPGDDAISVAETGRYEFTIGKERCVADVTRAATLTRGATGPSASRTAIVPPATTPTPSAPAAVSPRVDCSAPGEPVRLEVRPSRKLLRLGETFAFQGVVLDASGCPTGTPIQWAVSAVSFRDQKAHAGRPSIDALGRLFVPGDDFSDATFEVVAVAGSRDPRGARAYVEATSPANFEALLAQSGLDARGERDEPSVAVLATASIGATRSRAEDGAPRRRTTFIAVVAGLSVFLGAVAVVGARRARSARRAEKAAQERHAAKMRDYEHKKEQREQQHAAQMRAHVQSVAIAQQQAAAAAARGVEAGPSFCPSCRREFKRAGAFCPFDANRLVAIAGHEELLSGPPGGVCPLCRRGFNPGVRVCPHDGEELVPPAMVEATQVLPGPARGKICPTCGGRFEGNAAFCGKDGTQLVLLN
jgi:hypothetical protein